MKTLVVKKGGTKTRRCVVCTKRYWRRNMSETWIALKSGNRLKVCVKLCETCEEDLQAAIESVVEQTARRFGAKWI